MSMKITGYGTIGNSSGVNKKRGTAVAGLFSDILSAAEAQESASTSAASDVAAAAALNNLLALQEISEEDVYKRKMVQHGHSMLDALEKLRRQILNGVVAPHTLQDIGRQLAMQRQSVSDPQLLAIMDDIELRAAVELAKLEMAAAAQAIPVGEV